MKTFKLVLEIEAPENTNSTFPKEQWAREILWDIFHHAEMMSLTSSMRYMAQHKIGDTPTEEQKIYLDWCEDKITRLNKIYETVKLLEE